MPSDQGLRNPPLRDVAYSRFRECLFKSKLSPGQFVSQRQLCDLLDMPMGAVREALKRLEVDGLVVVLAQRGIQVRDVNVRLINEAFYFRLMIERDAARQFAVTGERRQLTQFADRTQSLIDRAHVAIDGALLDEALEVDMALHRTLVEGLDNSIILDTYRVLEDKIRLIRMNRRYTKGRLVIGMEEHLGIIKALLSGDAELAEKALEIHLKTSWRRSLGPEE